MARDQSSSIQINETQTLVEMGAKAAAAPARERQIEAVFILV